jgi:uncharacterized DUF497 family protein
MFEWDETKRLRIIHEVSLDFRDAVQIFDSRPVIHAPSRRNNENRFVSTAEIQGKLYTVVWMRRHGNQRIISFGRARDGEERAYCEVYG